MLYFSLYRNELPGLESFVPLSPNHLFTGRSWVWKDPRCLCPCLEMGEVVWGAKDIGRQTQKDSLRHRCLSAVLCRVLKSGQLQIHTATAYITAQAPLRCWRSVNFLSQVSWIHHFVAVNLHPNMPQQWKHNSVIMITCSVPRLGSSTIFHSL